MNKNKYESIIRTAEKYIPIVFLFSIIFLNTWFLACRGAAYIDADMAADVVYADMLNKNGQIISELWWHSTQLKLGEVLQFLQIGLLISPNNWVIARTIGIMLINLVLVIVYYFCSNQLEFGKNQSLLFATFMISPFGYFMLEFSTFGGFYTATLIYSLLCIMLIVMDIKKTNTPLSKKWYIYLSLAAIGIIMGISGLRYAIFPIIPLFVSALFFIFDVAHNRKEDIKDKTIPEIRLIITVSILVGTFLFGYIYNVLILAKKYTYEQFAEMTWGPLSFDNLTAGIFDYLSLFGYQYDEIMMMWTQQKAPISVFSLQGIASLFGILTAGMMVFSVIKLVCRYKKLDFVNRFLVVLLIISVAVSAVIFKLTKGFDAEAQYWIPLIGLSFLVIQAELNTEKLSLKYSKHCIILLLMFSISICSIASMKQYEKAPTHANPQLVNIAKLLQDQGYKQGYASFWHAAPITFLTNGEIDMWSIYEFTDTGVILKWLQKMDHLNPPTDNRTFALIGPIDGIDHDVYLPYMGGKARQEKTGADQKRCGSEKQCISAFFCQASCGNNASGKAEDVEREGKRCFRTEPAEFLFKRHDEDAPGIAAAHEKHGGKAGKEENTAFGEYAERHDNLFWITELLERRKSFRVKAKIMP